MAALMGLKESFCGGVGIIGNDVDSPAKEKAASRGVGGVAGRTSLLLQRTRQIFLWCPKIKILLAACLLFALIQAVGRIGSIFERNHFSFSSTDFSPSRSGYAVLINTWKRDSLLKQAVAHYASCSRTDAVRVVWSESDPPSDSLKSYLGKIVFSKSQSAHKPNFRFELNEKDSLNNRFKPIGDLQNDAIFSVDDDVIVPCSTLDFAFAVWQSAPDTMVGFVPRMHWYEKRSGVTYYIYGGWWSVWWMGTYSMVLSKAAFFHKKYLDLYTYAMPTSIHDYVARERNCEDIAMSLLVSNTSGAPPIWVKGKIYDIGDSGISSLHGHNERRNRCLNDFVSLYGVMPLITTSMKAVDARHEWFW